MDSAIVDQTSDQFVGQWKKLVSTTNWEKGRIIHEWREALRESEAPATEYSDEAWCRRVGHVTPQHVGRLRRVFHGFSAVREDYPGLFWSHFQAALDWTDAEMWLEGAVQNGWSIAQMRALRHETLGTLADDEAAQAETEEPWDDDAEPVNQGEVVGSTVQPVRDPGRSVDESAEDDADTLFDEAEPDQEPTTAQRAAKPNETGDPVEPFKPFAALPPLPADVNDAFEAYKLCILRHKLAGWQEIARDDLVASLESLKQLALAPADN